MKNTGSMKKYTIFLLLLFVVVITVLPLFLQKDAAFEGADGQAEEVVLEIRKDFVPWFSPLYEPNSGEIESLLFALQAALGAGIIGYAFGYLRGRNRKDELPVRA